MSSLLLTVTAEDQTHSHPPQIDASTADLSDSSVQCNGERFKLYLHADAIQERIEELGRMISADCAGQRPVLVGVLNGAFMFLSDLMRSITIECEVDFIKLSSYGDKKISSGVVRELKSVDANLHGKNVIIVEDIVDTGLSMAYLVETVREHEPASVRTATLLHKSDATVADVSLDYVGFEISNLFVVGYGLDYGQLGRNLPHIYVIDESRNEGGRENGGSNG